MSSTKAKARFAGLMYLLLIFSAPLSLLYLPSHFFVKGNAAATALNITAEPTLYRSLLLVDLASSIAFLFIAWALYELFKDVSRKQARLLVMMVMAGAIFQIVNLLNLTAPLLFLSGADFLSAFTRPQLESLSLASIRLHSLGIYIVYAFWGLWLFPFGILVMRSGFLPKILGILLIVAGIAELIVCVTGMVFPAYANMMFNLTTPFDALGEVPIALWLLIKGAKEQPATAASADVPSTTNRSDR
jgi:hypothetical protein